LFVISHVITFILQDSVIKIDLAQVSQVVPGLRIGNEGIKIRHVNQPAIADKNVILKDFPHD